jgi:GGDEF domain-containing protein
MSLKVLALRMVGYIRASDTVARLAGDEFIILVNEQAPDSHVCALSIVERLRL